MIICCIYKFFGQSRAAWKNLEDLPKGQAMEGYVALVDKHAPGWRTAMASDSRLVGPVLSSLAHDTVDLADAPV